MALSIEAVVGTHDIGEEDVRRLAAKLQRCRIRIVGGGWAMT